MAIEIHELKNFNVKTASEQELRELVEHLQKQMNETYVYWVGEWAGSRKAKSTRNGEYVSKEEVINYLNN
jgi:hypothetical protein